MRIILPLSLLYAMYATLKGHNEPGGGFIGGMIFSTAVLTYRMSHGFAAQLRLIPIHPRILIFLGLSMALGTSIVPLVFGLPFLRSAVGEFHMPFMHQPWHYASAMVFDLGVMFVVVGVAVGMISQLTEEIE
jgi:multisubunit Na+/H+ antiporter MnhB subunit